MTEPVVQRPLLVGISGKIGSGKTTLAHELEKANTGATAFCNFADELKKEAAETLGVPLERFSSQEEKNKPVSDTDTLTHGEALQQIGAKRRMENKDYWVERLGEHIAQLTDVSLVIVGDVRHLNEAEWITKQGGLLVRLNGDPGGVRAASTRDHTHPSETDLDNYDDFDLVFNTNDATSAAIAAQIMARLAWPDE